MTPHNSTPTPPQPPLPSASDGALAPSIPPLGSAAPASDTPPTLGTPGGAASGVVGEGEKSFVATWLLSWLLGVVGADRFYLGKTGSGLAKLFTLGGFGIWWLVDLVMVLTNTTRDKAGLALQGYQKHKKIAWIVTAAAIVLGLIINAVSPKNDAPATPADTSSISAPAAEKPADEAPAEQPVEEEPAVKEEPAVELGTAITSPLPLGTEVDVKSWAGKFAVSLGPVNWDASGIIADENPFNAEPADGMKYIMVEATITNNDTESWSAGGTFFWGDIKLVADGRGFSEGAIVVLPNDLSSQGDLYPGGTASGNVAFLVPVEITEGVWDIDGTFVAAQ